MTATLTLIPAVGQAYAFQEDRGSGNRIRQITRSRGWIVPEYPVAGETARADDLIKMPMGLAIEGDMSADEARAGGAEKIEALGDQILTVQIRADRLPDGVPEVLPLMTIRSFTDVRDASGGLKWTLQLQQVLVSAATTVFVTPVPGRAKVAGASNQGTVPMATPDAQTTATTPKRDVERLVDGAKALARLVGG